MSKSPHCFLQCWHLKCVLVTLHIDDAQASPLGLGVLVKHELYRISNRPNSQTVWDSKAFVFLFFLNLLRKRRQGLKEFKFGGIGRKKMIKGDKKALNVILRSLALQWRRQINHRQLRNVEALATTKTAAHLRDLDSSDSRFQNKCFLCKFMKFQ